MINELDMGKYIKSFEDFEKVKGEIKLIPGNKYSLANISSDRINIVKVKSSSDDIHSLIPFIKIETEIGDEKKDRLFHPIAYQSIYEKGIETHKEFKFPITNCQNTTISTENNYNLSEYFLTIYWEAIPIWINEITILLSKQSEGYTFSLHPLSLREIKQYSSNALSGSIFISYETKQDFEIFQGNIIPHVIQTLTDLDDEDLLHIGTIKFLNPSEGKIIHTEYPNV